MRDLPTEPEEPRNGQRQARHAYRGPRRRARLPRVPSSVDSARRWRRLALAGWVLCVLVAVGYAVVLSWWPAALCAI